MKYILVIIASLTIGVFIGYKLGTKSGFESGKEEGYITGYSEGEAKGREDGKYEQMLIDEEKKRAERESLKIQNNSKFCNEKTVLDNFNKYMKEFYPNHKIDKKSIMVSNLENCRYMIRFRATEAYNPEGFSELYHRHRVIFYYADDFKKFGIEKIDFTEL